MEDRLKSTRNIPLDEIYVPAKHKKTLEPEKIDAIAESMLEDGQQNPIQLRQGKGRFVLVQGLHRLEACKALGEETIQAIFVQAQRR
jgi:sulfiredoxin